ncbi:hypothetical protein HYR99_18150 [Candidatus Poribacteria bacterium]|nr:hypothetical protein [Candidatus Poribacteria bacterium]
MAGLDGRDDSIVPRFRLDNNTALQAEVSRLIREAALRAEVQRLRRVLDEIQQLFMSNKGTRGIWQLFGRKAFGEAQQLLQQEQKHRYSLQPPWAEVQRLQGSLDEIRQLFLSKKSSRGFRKLFGRKVFNEVQQLLQQELEHLYSLQSLVPNSSPRRGPAAGLEERPR